MNKKYTAAILVVLVAAAEANVVKTKPSTLPLAFQEKWGDSTLSADVNEYVDKTIYMLEPIMRQHGLDPMDLPEVVEGFSVRPLLITYSAWLKIYDGYMTGLVNVARSGDQMVHYDDKMIRVRLELQFTDLEFIYKYLVQVMNIGPTGGIIGSLDRFVVIIDLVMDFNKDEIELQQFRLTNIGRLRVRFTGNILTDWLLNPVLNLFLVIFDTIIIQVVALTIRSSIQQAIGLINANIRIVIDILESFN